MLFFDGFDAKKVSEECVIPWDDDNANNEQMEQLSKKQKTN